jgi:hypothetical protein
MTIEIISLTAAWIATAVALLGARPAVLAVVHSIQPRAR